MLLTTNTDFNGLARLSPVSRLPSTAVGANRNFTGDAPVEPSSSSNYLIFGPRRLRAAAGGNPADAGKVVNLYGYTVASGVLKYSKDTITLQGATESAFTALSFAQLSFAQVVSPPANFGDIIIESEAPSPLTLVTIRATRNVSESATIGLPAASIALIHRLQVRVTGSNPLVSAYITTPVGGFGSVPFAWFESITSTTPLDCVFDPPLFVPSVSSSGISVSPIGVRADSGGLATSVQAILSATVFQAVTSQLF